MASSQSLHIIILGAGLGTRMRSAQPKVLHKLGGRTLLEWVIGAARSLSPQTITLVHGPEFKGQDLLIAGVDRVLQDDRLGTGHAVQLAFAHLQQSGVYDARDDYLVLYGDTPFIETSTLQKLHKVKSDKKAGLMALGFRPKDGGQYGRLIIDTMGSVHEIREYADLVAAYGREKTEEFTLCNAGILLAQGGVLASLLDKLTPHNVKGEYYLTDLFALAHSAGIATNYTLADASEVMGINSRDELARAEASLQARMRSHALNKGVTLVAPETVYFSFDTKLGRDVIIHPFVVFGPGVQIADGVEVHSFSHIEGAAIETGASIGPYARIRPQTQVREGARVGNFVELKNTTLGQGSKANHLSYLGDASLGSAVNIGAGTIICNYDGFSKHKTVIGDKTFVGSNSALVAPLAIGSEVVIGAGSTITHDVPDGALTLSRAKQEVKEGAGKDYRQKKQAEKVTRLETKKPG